LERYWEDATRVQDFMGKGGSVELSPFSASPISIDLTKSYVPSYGLDVNKYGKQAQLLPHPCFTATLYTVMLL